MKSNCIRIFQTGLPYADGAYVRGAGNAIETATASIVVTGTGAGQQGCGGFTLCGGNCIAAHSESVPPLARLIAPALTGGAPMYRIVPPKGTAETIAGMGGCRTQGYCRLQVKTGGDRAETGKLYAPDAPGLGAAPDFECPGTPAAAFGTAK